VSAKSADCRIDGLQLRRYISDISFIDMLYRFEVIRVLQKSFIGKYDLQGIVTLDVNRTATFRPQV